MSDIPCGVSYHDLLLTNRKRAIIPPTGLTLSYCIRIQQMQSDPTEKLWKGLKLEIGGSGLIQPQVPLLARAPQQITSPMISFFTWK